MLNRWVLRTWNWNLILCWTSEFCIEKFSNHFEKVFRTNFVLTEFFHTEKGVSSRSWIQNHKKGHAILMNDSSRGGAEREGKSFRHEESRRLKRERRRRSVEEREKLGRKREEEREKKCTAPYLYGMKTGTTQVSSWGRESGGEREWKKSSSTSSYNFDPTQVLLSLFSFTWRVWMYFWVDRAILLPGGQKLQFPSWIDWDYRIIIL